MNSILVFLYKSPDSHMFQYGSVKKGTHLICRFQFLGFLILKQKPKQKRHRLPVKKHQMQENQIVRRTVFRNFNFVQM